MTNSARYAVLFKAFFLDEFVIRRLARVVAAAPSGDVYLMLDETNASAGPSSFPRIIRYCEADVIALGFLKCGQGSLFWYNADYPLYYFQHLWPDYKNFVVIEYDAVPNINLDVMVAACTADAIDFVGQPIAKTLDSYWWTSTMLRYYPRAAVRPTLMCVALFSAAAVRHLAACRLRQGAEHNPADTKHWPIGETFVGTELAVGGFRSRDLASFGVLTRYDWWPPTHESELSDCAAEIFVHPVLTGRLYVRSLFKSGIISGVIIIVKLGAAWLSRRRRGITMALSRH
ncbi:MAG: hypothetical protein H7251_03795 [Acetobacteraceae bacterium]|nr:hypothetical protein [Acetobacteraceae bacterium]